MPRHLDTNMSVPRWIILSLTAVVLIAIGLGVWWFATSSTTSAGTDTPSPPPASAGKTDSPSTPSTPATPPVSATPTATPTPVLNPLTGRVDTLDGLVPDYVLPPIENGMVPVLTKVPTEQKVVFLTIDDGAVKRDSDLALLEQHGIKASLFLANTFIANDPGFYKKYTGAGHLIENHTMSHSLGFLKLSYAAQKAEICAMADFEEKQYGRRPVFFRPPGGPYSQATRQAVADCGMKAIVDWEAKANAGGMDYQVGASLRPGDIVLMHFRPEFPADLDAFLAAQKAAGLKVVLLEDYLGTK
ncbi:polysaccharide deacetylase [Arthrobacter alpinus]|uniref:Polysaccharide deacetylase n=1 Tax=Arthrobacter alpinus TaxID=656366 RepID=A0A0M5LXZ7_9MICC|nr:polysaccharide deacetylase family protein [Arthrobacter alpinus]ALE93607.1 polysaccharide deacetylase [Arthrobacter alpinus]